MGAPSPPTPPSPGQSAQAEAGSEAAGKMMDIANAPIAGYANAYTSGMINPYTSALATALANKGALANAQAQRTIQSQVDPQAFNEREMAMQGANRRLGLIYRVTPGSASYNAPGAFAVPSTGLLPDLGELAKGAGAIAGNIRSVSLDKSGGNPQLLPPQNPGSVNPPYLRVPNNYLYQ